MIIRIKNLRAKTLLGIFPEERTALRDVTLNLLIEYDHEASLVSDNVADVPDYGIIEQTIVDSLPMQTFYLLEPLAEHVAQLAMSFPNVTTVTVEIEKPGALKHADMVSVLHTVTRS